MLLHSLAIIFTSIAVFTTAAPISKRSISDGPVIASNFPDPSFIQVGTTYYAFSTNQIGGKHVPAASSPDMINWTLLPDDALPQVGAWSNGDAVWAPDVVQLADDSFVMYYTARLAANPSTHCLGAATASSPAGPYIARPEILACPPGGGAIDPSGFQDYDGSRYVVYKVDGNNIGHGGNCNNGIAPIVPTPIMLQEVDRNDGYTLIGGSRQLLDRGEFDGPLIEAPSLIRVPEVTAAGGWMYVLFFSSNCFAGGLYDTSYATSITGLFHDSTDYDKAAEPLLVTGSLGGKLYSPGGMKVGADGVNVLFHADLGTSDAVRQMWTGVINIVGRIVTIE